MAAALVVPAGASSAALRSLTATNVACTSAGYSLTVNGSGLPANAAVILWVFDNLNPGPPPAGQYVVVTTDATGSFTRDFPAGGPAQTLPAQIEVTDAALNLLAGPDTVSPVTCTAPLPPDLVVVNTASAPAVAVGDSIDYTVSVSNLGPGAAQNVRLTDSVLGPVGASSLEATGCVPTSSSCVLETIAPGAARTVTVVVTTNGPGAVQNTATATTTDADANLSNNTATAPAVAVVVTPPPPPSVSPPPPPPPSVSPPPPPVCSTAAHVSGDGSFVFADATARISVRAECDESGSGTYALTHARLSIQWAGAASPMPAKTNPSSVSVTTLALNGGDATLAGTDNGVPFVVTLHDGGQGRSNGGDTMEVVSGSFTTAASVPENVSTSVESS